MKKEQNKTIPGGKNGKPEFIPSERRRSGQADPDIDCMFFGGSSVSCTDPGQDTRERLMPELFTCDLTEFFETCEIYADSSELNSILVVSDGTEHEAALHNLMVDFFALLKTDGYLIKEDPMSCDPCGIHPGKRLSEFQLDFPASYSRKASCDLSGSGAEDAASRSC